MIAGLRLAICGAGASAWWRLPTAWSASPVPGRRFGAFAAARWVIRLVLSSCTGCAGVGCCWPEGCGQRRCKGLDDVVDGHRGDRLNSQQVAAEEDAGHLCAEGGGAVLGLLAADSLGYRDHDLALHRLRGETAQLRVARGGRNGLEQRRAVRRVLPRGQHAPEQPGGEGVEIPLEGALLGS